MKNFFKKTISSLVIISLFVPFIPIPKAEAALPVVIVGDISAPSHFLNATNLSLQHVKDFVLNGLANALMKQLAQQITNSIVNWINSGFDGSPAFVQNPSAFFLDVADQVTGEFIYSKDGGGILGQLCSPFSIDLRIALSFKYHPSLQKRYTCTLGTVIANSKSAIKNASINGFTAGDFRQGGWPAFISLTTEPQNNIFGAYLSADSDISYRVAQYQGQKRDQLAQGRGFLSWEKCETYQAATNELDDNGDINSAYLINDNAAGSDDGDITSASVNSNYMQTQKKCSIQTPGSVIAGSLDAHLSGPLRELELANKINEIVNALFAQLARMVLQKGLAAVSGSGPGDKSSYINQIQESITTGNENLQSIKTNFASNIDQYLKNSLEYKSYKDSAFNFINNIKLKLEEARACFAGQTGQGTGTNVLSEIDSDLAKINAVWNKVSSEATQAGNRYNALLNIKNSLSTSNTIEDINSQTDTFMNAVSGQSILTENDVDTAKQDYESLISDYRRYELDAYRYASQCANNTVRN